jgi:transposase
MKRRGKKAVSDAQKVELLEAKVDSLEQQLEWFRRQLFGRKSEKRLIEPNPDQLPLKGWEGEQAAKPEVSKQSAPSRARSRKVRAADCVTDTGLRFGPEVPKQTIRLPCAELDGPDANEYEWVRDEVTYRLAQRYSSAVVLEYIRPVVKRRSSGQLLQPPAPANVLDGSIVDVSAIAAMLVEKFIYHLPLYRQHQRLSQDGIKVARASLSQWVHRAIALLTPIYQAQLRHVLQSRILAIDETPIRAGVEQKASGPNKMKLGWLWPILGDENEVMFTYSPSRGHQHLLNTLGEFNGVILSDGYSAYDAYAAKCQGVTRAQCWVHSRREFVKAEQQEPEAVAQALDRIGKLYQLERHARGEKLDLEQHRAFRITHSKPVVDEFFAWCEHQCQRLDLVPSNRLSKALKYVQKREAQLRLFLAEPELPLDTNHVERTLRVIPTGRKNWLFAWTEIGAERIGIIQSLLSTCRLHDVHPYVYLVDVLQRISEHPASDVEQLTPRVWKTLYADNPLRSDLDQQPCQ